METIKQIKKKYPNAKNITYGTNNIVNGYWFEDGEEAKHRIFIPENLVE